MAAPIAENATTSPPVQSNSTNGTPIVPQPAPIGQPQANQVPVATHQRVSSAPSFTKATPNDLYRRLLPAGLFLLTFVTVMTLLLIYMDTTALRAQQFRANMSRDLEFVRVDQADPFLVEYVRQVHLVSQPSHHSYLEKSSSEDTAGNAADIGDDLADGGDEKLKLILGLVKNKRNGTFVEALSRGTATSVTSYLVTRRGWRGLRVRADPRAALALRPSVGTPVVQACLSTIPHPKEITYRDPPQHWAQGAPDTVSVDVLPASAEDWFSPRLKCFPLYTLLLAVGATRADYLVVEAPGQVGEVLATVPFGEVRVQVLEVIVQADDNVDSITAFLHTKGYKFKAKIGDSVIYVLINGPTPMLKI